MPRARFRRLTKAKQQRLLDAASAELAERGYHGASLNRILRQAGLSKGAAYYYFEDRDDLFATVLLDRITRSLRDIELDPAALTADSFWDVLMAVVAQISDPDRFEPWVIPLARTVYSLPPERRESGAMADLWEQIHGWTRAIIERGRELGVIRADLPVDLLVSTAMAVDEAVDRYVLDVWDELTRQELQHLGAAAVGMVRRMLEPPQDAQP